jgi:hypothetical protein
MRQRDMRAKRRKSDTSRWPAETNAALPARSTSRADCNRPCCLRRCWRVSGSNRVQATVAIRGHPWDRSRGVSYFCGSRATDGSGDRRSRRSLCRRSSFPGQGASSSMQGNELKSAEAGQGGSWCDPGRLSWVRVSGADAARFLDNFTTAAVGSVAEGHGCEGFFTDVRGQVICLAGLLRCGPAAGGRRAGRGDRGRRRRGRRTRRAPGAVSHS